MLILVQISTFVGATIKIQVCLRKVTYLKEPANLRAKVQLG